MFVLKILNIVLVLMLLVFGIEAIIKIKKSESKKIDDVRKSLLIRIDIIMVLTVLTAIVTILNVLFNK